MQKLGTFKPKNLVEALDALKKASHPEGLESFSNVTEEVLHGYQRSLGKTISTEWKIGQNSHIEVYFRNQGIDNATRMVQILILAFHRYLNGEPCSLESVKKDVVSRFK